MGPSSSVPQEYKKGAQVQVRFDPRRHSESVLQAGADNYAIGMFLGGATLVVIACGAAANAYGWTNLSGM